MSIKASRSSFIRHMGHEILRKVPFVVAIAVNVHFLFVCDCPHCLFRGCCSVFGMSGLILVSDLGVLMMFYCPCSREDHVTLLYLTSFGK